MKGDENGRRGGGGANSHTYNTNTVPWIIIIIQKVNKHN